MQEEQKAEAQLILDELFADGLIPFKLSAQAIESIGGDESMSRSKLASKSSSALTPKRNSSFMNLLD